jgi:hypothetical protein
VTRFCGSTSVFPLSLSFYQFSLPISILILLYQKDKRAKSCQTVQGFGYRGALDKGYTRTRTDTTHGHVYPRLTLIQHVCPCWGRMVTLEARWCNVCLRIKCMIDRPINNKSYNAKLQCTVQKLCFIYVNSTLIH